MNKFEKRTYIIYGLYSSDNPHFYRYIGVTSTNLKQRFRQHKYNSKHSEKRALPVHKWMYSHYTNGEEIFIEEIEKCTESTWEEREQFWIKKLKESNNLLNIDRGGKGVVIDGHRPEESIKRSVESKKIAIVQLSLNGEYIKEYSSIAEAAQIHNVSSSAIVFAIKTKSVCVDCLWVYKDKYQKDKKYVLKHNIEQSIKIAMYSKNKELVKIFDKKTDVLKFLEVNSYNGLASAIKNKKLYHGYYFDFYDKKTTSNTFYIYDIKDKELKNPIYTFSKIKELAEYFGVTYNTLSARFKKYGSPCEYRGFLIYRN